MIAYLHGKITYLAADCCYIDVNGIGYRVFISSVVRSRLHLNEEITLYTYLSVREDAMVLYGFTEQTDYDIFCKLISVSKIGPKGAMGLLSALTGEKLVWAVQNEQISLLTNAPGIGKKTAERLVLELKDKFKDIAVAAQPVDEQILIDTKPLPKADNYGEASEALLQLGYTRAEISSVLKKAGKLASTQEIIKFALKELSL